MEKAPAGVASIAARLHKPAAAFSGCVTDDARARNDAGIDAVFPIPREASCLEAAMDSINAARNMTDVFRPIHRTRQ